jgi:hypothetical protein
MTICVGHLITKILRNGPRAHFPFNIAEGKIRPEAPMQAAKLASEGGIILRQQMPILRHWKEYKKDKSIVTNYISKVAVSEIQSFNVTPFKYYSTFLHFLNSNVYALY